MTDQSRLQTICSTSHPQHLSLSLSTPSPTPTHLPARHVPRETRLLHHPNRQCHRHPLRRPLPSPKYAQPRAPCLTLEELTTTVGWGRTQADPGFGSTHDNSSVKAKSVNLIASVRTVMRSMFIHRHICHRGGGEGEEDGEDHWLTVLQSPSS